MPYRKVSMWANTVFFLKKYRYTIPKEEEGLMKTLVDGIKDHRLNIFGVNGSEPHLRSRNENEDL